MKRQQSVQGRRARSERCAMHAAICAAFLLLGSGALAQEPAAIDWQHRVIRATGVGAPDLDAPSIAVGRTAATRAALAAAQRNALGILERATLDDGSRVATVFEADGCLRPVKTHYFTDGGVSLQIEVPFALLPPDIAERMHPPPAPEQSPSGTAPPVGSDQPPRAAVPGRAPAASDPPRAAVPGRAPPASDQPPPAAAPGRAPPASDQPPPAAAPERLPQRAPSRAPAPDGGSEQAR
jgi:hypothetical protein